MLNHTESFEQLRPVANMIVDQAFRFLQEVGVERSRPAFDSEISLRELVKRASLAHQGVANLRSATGANAWATLRIANRKAEPFFEELDGVLTPLVRMQSAHGDQRR